jgi:hypothetical protein
MTDLDQPTPDPPQNTGRPDQVEDDAAVLSAAEQTDQDVIGIEPVEADVDPPDHWAAANRFGTTAREQREGESLDEKLAEERPDVRLDDVPDHPVADTPVDDLDSSVDQPVDNPLDESGVHVREDVPDGPID